MKELNFHPRIFSTYILECYAPAKSDRAFYEGIKFTHPLNSAIEDAEHKRFAEALAARERPGQNTNVNAFFAYDGLTQLSRGIEQCTEIDPKCLYEHFTGLGRIHGVSGEMQFLKSGALKRPYGLKIVKNGEFEWLERRGLSGANS